MRQALAFGQALVANEHSLVGSIKGQLANLLEKQQKLKPSGEESESVVAQQREIEELWKGALESLHHTAKHPTSGSNSNGSNDTNRSKRSPVDGRHDVKNSRSNRVRDGARRFNIAQV
jgi:phage-related minor tail protein